MTKYKSRFWFQLQISRKVFWLVHCRTYACPLTISLTESLHRSLAAKSILNHMDGGGRRESSPRYVERIEAGKKGAGQPNEWPLWTLNRRILVAEALERGKWSKRDYNGKWAPARILDNINICKRTSGTRDTQKAERLQKKRGRAIWQRASHTWTEGWGSGLKIKVHRPQALKSFSIATARLNLGNFILSERGRTQKAACCMIPFPWNIQNR